MGIDRLEQEHPVHVQWRGFPLRPRIPLEGLPLEKALGTDADEAWAMVRSLQDTAGEFGLPFGDLKRVSNSRMAQELAAWADSLGRARAVHDQAFRAYFAGGKNLSELSVLLDLAEAAGLDRKEASRVLEERSFGELVDADWTLSRELGIRVVPTFLTGGRRLEGVKPYETLKAWFRGDDLGILL